MFVFTFAGAFDLMFSDFCFDLLDHFADLTVKYVDPLLPIISKCSYPNFMYVI